MLLVHKDIISLQLEIVPSWTWKPTASDIIILVSKWKRSFLTAIHFSSYFFPLLSSFVTLPVSFLPSFQHSFQNRFLFLPFSSSSHTSPPSPPTFPSLLILSPLPVPLFPAWPPQQDCCPIDWPRDNLLSLITAIFAVGNPLCIITPPSPDRRQNIL